MAIGDGTTPGGMKVGERLTVGGLQGFSAGERMHALREGKSAGLGGGQIAGGAFADAVSGPGRQAPESNTAGMQIALRQADRMRAQQQGAADLMQQAALGETPSAAQIQQQQGIEQGMRQQLAMANSARAGGGASVNALRGAQDMNAQMTQQGAQQGAMLRAQEMAQARGALAQNLAGMQQQDQARAGMQLQMGMADQAAGLQARGMDDARMLGLGGLTQGFNQMETDVSMANAANDLQRELGIVGLDLEAMKQNAAIERDELAMALGATSGLMGGMMGASGPSPGSKG